MGRFREITSFILVAEKGSFAAAAVEQGVTPVIMGRRLNALEKRLGVQLMHRSTRGLTLTELGEQYLELCREVVKDLSDADENIMSQRSSLVGCLQLSAPASFGRQHVAQHALEFHRRHPGLELSLNLTDSLVDLVAGGYDLAIRIGEVLDPNYVSVRLYPNQRVVCGTPEYFNRYGVPREPKDLEGHNCLAFNMQGGQHRGWMFARDGKEFAVRVRGNLSCNDGDQLYQWVLAGLGVGWRSTWEIQRDLKNGKLITVLDEYALPDYDIQAVYPRQLYLPTKVRYFIDMLKDLYNQPSYWS